MSTKNRKKGEDSEATEVENTKGKIENKCLPVMLINIMTSKWQKSIYHTGPEKPQNESECVVSDILRIN